MTRLGKAGTPDSGTEDGMGIVLPNEIEEMAARRASGERFASVADHIAQLAWPVRGYERFIIHHRQSGNWCVSCACSAVPSRRRPFCARRSEAPKKPAHR